MQYLNNSEKLIDRGGIVTGVVRVIDVKDGIALVEPESKSGCSSCSMSKGCGTNMLAGYFTRNMQPLKIANEFDAKIGDRIEVGMENATILTLSMTIYLLPLVSMIGAAIIAESYAVSDLSSLFMAAMGLSAGFLISRSIYRSSYFSHLMALTYLAKVEGKSQEKVTACATDDLK